MKPNDKISVLVCAHSPNKIYDSLLRRALVSLQKQTFLEFQTVVVLDACWDGTMNVIAEFEDSLHIDVLERNEKRGLAVAKNAGLEICSGDWVAFLDADDEYVDCKLQMQRSFLINNPKIDICGTLAWDRKDGKMYPSCFKPGQYETHSQIANRLKQENVMCHGSIIARKSALVHVGGYETGKFALGKEDWATWLKLIEAGFTFHNIPERLYIWSANTSVTR